MRRSFGGAVCGALFIALLTYLPFAASAAPGNVAAYLPLIIKAKASTPAPIPTPPPTSPTPPPTGATNDFQVRAATYLGSNGADTAKAVDIAPDGTVVLGGVLPGYGGGTATTLLGGTDGTVVRLGDGGTTVRSVTRIGAKVNDLAVNDAGVIAVCGDFGVAVLKADGSAVVWSAKPGEASRCAVGADGTVAALVGGSAFVYDTAGVPLGNWSIGGKEQTDIAIDGASQTVYAGGYTQKDQSGFCQGKLKVAFLRAWSYSGQLKWTDYDASAQDSHAAGQCADSSVRRITLGHDGKLYVVGWTDGGNSALRRDPQNVGAQLAAGIEVTTDAYNNPYGLKGAKSLAWYGRFVAASGVLERGQMLLTRNGNEGNSIAVYGIAADEQGQVYLAGEQYFEQESRSTRSVAGTLVGNYEGGEAFLLVLSSDWRTRLVWTPFAAPGASAGGSPASGVAVRGPVAALALTLNAPKDAGQVRKLITYEALQPTPGTLPDAYLAVWQP